MDQLRQTYWVLVEEPAEAGHEPRRYGMPASLLDPVSDPDSDHHHVNGSALRWQGIRQWLALAFRLGSRTDPCSDDATMCAKLYRSLTPAAIFASRDQVAILELRDMLLKARYCNDAVPAGSGLKAVLDECGLEALLEATHRQLGALSRADLIADNRKAERG